MKNNPKNLFIPTIHCIFVWINTDKKAVWKQTAYIIIVLFSILAG